MQPAETSIARDRSRLTQGTTLLAVLGCYFLFNVAVRLIMPHGLELDEAEQTHFSQWLLAGYSSQPPLYNWLQYGAVHIFGMSLATLSLLKNLLLFCSYLFYWLAARQVLCDKRLAIAAALGLLTIPQVAFEAQRDLSHTVAAIFGASLFLFCLLRLLKAPSLAAFLLFGLATGIGGITKYNFAVLPIASGIAVLLDREMRARVLDWRIVPAAVLALLIVSPHALWLADNFQAAGGHTINKLVDEKTGFLISIVDGFGSLALACLGFLALTLAVFALAFREDIRSIARASTPWTRLVGRILLASLSIIVLMILLAGLENVRDRWLTPILLPAPLYLALKLDAAGVSIMPGLRRLWLVAGVVMVIVPSVLFGRVAMDRIGGRYGYVNIPFPELSETVREKAAGADTVVVASDGQLGGNIHFNQPDLLVLTPRPPFGMRQPALTNFRRIVLIWRNSDGSEPLPLDRAFRGYLQAEGLNAITPAEMGVVAYPYSWGRAGDEYRFGYAVIDLPAAAPPTP